MLFLLLAALCGTAHLSHVYLTSSTLEVKQGLDDYLSANPETAELNFLLGAVTSYNILEVVVDACKKYGVQLDTWLEHQPEKYQEAVDLCFSDDLPNLDRERRRNREIAMGSKSNRRMMKIIQDTYIDVSKLAPAEKCYASMRAKLNAADVSYLEQSLLRPDFDLLHLVTKFNPDLMAKRNDEFPISTWIVLASYYPEHLSLITLPRDKLNIVSLLSAKEEKSVSWAPILRMMVSEYGLDRLKIKFRQAFLSICPAVDFYLDLVAHHRMPSVVPPVISAEIEEEWRHYLSQ